MCGGGVGWCHEGEGVGGGGVRRGACEPYKICLYSLENPLLVSVALQVLKESMTEALHRHTVCQADHKALGNLLLRSLQAVHCEYGRGQVDTEAALALQVEALHCAVGAANQEAFVAVCNPQRQRLHAPALGRSEVEQR